MRREMSESTVDVTVGKCLFCGRDAVITTDVDTAHRIVMWLTTPRAHREHVQFAFPGLPAAEREMMISGTHDTCFNDVFGDDDDDVL